VLDLTTLSQLTGIPITTIEYWQTLSAVQIVHNRDYIDALRDVDRLELESSFNEIRTRYQGHLVHFQRMLAQRYGVHHAPMFSEILGHWVLSAVEQPSYLEHVIKRHARMPREMISDGLPMLVDMLASPSGERNEWQRAVVLLTLPMLLG